LPLAVESSFKRFTRLLDRGLVAEDFTDGAGIFGDGRSELC
jgi:hypothetical protein